MFEGYFGQALHVARVSARLSQEEVLNELNRHNETILSLAQFDGMEKDIEDIGTDTFEIWCQILPWSKAKIEKYAQLLQQSTHQPEQELLQEVIDEVEYELWKHEQQDQ